MRQSAGGFFAHQNPKNPIWCSNRRWKNPPSACCARGSASTPAWAGRDWCNSEAAGHRGQQRPKLLGPGLSVLTADKGELAKP